MCKFKENVTSGVFNAIQLASIKAMDEGDKDIHDILGTYHRRREMALKAFDQMGVFVNPGMGTLPVAAGPKWSIFHGIYRKTSG